MKEQDQLSPEILVPRLGEHLVTTGLLTDDQLHEALRYQKDQAGRGLPVLLGQALLDLNFMDRKTLDRAVTEQIIMLRSALEDANRNLERRVQERTAELEEALRKLSELNQLKANIVANVSHELRTPLTHIKGYLELLVTESLGSLTDDQRKALEVSQKSALRLQNLIDDLILFSLAARGEMTLQLRAVNLNSIISKALERVRSKAEDKQIAVEASVDPNLPLAQADEEKLAWVLSQLLDNAVKFTNAGGRVILKTRRDNDKLINVAVTDTGIGIPEERLHEAFDAFHQLDGSATRRYGGTGLGLALVKQIIEAHGSLIEVQSKLNVGTTFSFPLLIAATAAEGK
jgi:signal transduction histidine kinase